MELEGGWAPADAKGTAREIRPREVVVLASNFARLVAWYRDVLDFRVRQLLEDGFHYAQLETRAGQRIGIADAAEMGVTPSDRSGSTVVLHVEVDDVRALFDHVVGNGGTVAKAPRQDPERQLTVWNMQRPSKFVWMRQKRRGRALHASSRLLRCELVRDRVPVRD